jgi:hypothetical protein
MADYYGTDQLRYLAREDALALDGLRTWVLITLELISPRLLFGIDRSGMTRVKQRVAKDMSCADELVRA